MATQLAKIRWVRVIITAVLTFVVSFVLLFGLVTGYASILAFQARGTPDPVQINQFADQVAPWAGPIILILLTLVAAIWLGRRVGEAGALNGLVMGLLLGVLSLAIGLSFTLPELAQAVLVVAAGWLGGRVGSRMRQNQVASRNTMDSKPGKTEVS